MENVKFHNCKANMFPFQQNSSITYSRFRNTVSSPDGILNFADVFERYMVNTVTPSDSLIAGWALIALFPVIIHRHTHSQQHSRMHLIRHL
jgi:hypothetical protein